MMKNNYKENVKNDEKAILLALIFPIEINKPLI